jgi:hypothetical protein
LAACSKKGDASLNTALIIHPIYATLKKEVERLKAELSSLLLEQDALIYHECPDIQMRYQVLFGPLEIEKEELELAILRARRKLSLIQAKVNRREVILTFTIELVLDEEFKDYQEKTEKKRKETEKAFARSKKPVLKESESSEIKRLYRRIVKALHPDLNPNVTEIQKQWLLEAVDAYQVGDLKAMRRISDLLIDMDIASEEIQDLPAQKKRLLETIERVREEIRNLKSMSPYILKVILDSQELIEKEKANLQKSIQELRKELLYVETRIAEALV